MARFGNVLNLGFQSHSSQQPLQGFSRALVFQAYHANKTAKQSLVKATDKGALKRLYQFLLRHGWQ
jgi:hypothetical protein